MLLFIQRKKQTTKRGKQAASDAIHTHRSGAGVLPPYRPQSKGPAPQPHIRVNRQCASQRPSTDVQPATSGREFLLCDKQSCWLPPRASLDLPGLPIFSNVCSIRLAMIAKTSIAELTRSKSSSDRFFKSRDRLLASPLQGYEGRVFLIIFSTISANANSFNVAAFISALLSSQLCSTPAAGWPSSASLTQLRLPRNLRDSLPPTNLDLTGFRKQYGVSAQRCKRPAASAQVLDAFENL